jgi:hypothetical protein
MNQDGYFPDIQWEINGNKLKMISGNPQFANSNLPERNLENRNDLLDYLGCKNRTNRFVEGNVYILSKKIVDILFVDKKLYNILNEPGDFDYNWVRKRYGLSGSLNTIYKEFKEKKLSPRDNLSYDGYIEHAFERVVLNLCENTQFLYLRDQKINILIRNTYRPSYFPKCINSILNQTHQNFKVIMCYDDDDCLEYLDKYKNNPKIEIFKATEVNRTGQAFYNLYCNQLLDKVKKGWIMFLDDDDLLINKNSLQNIASNLDNKDDMLFWKVKIANRIIYPKNIHNIEKFNVSGIGFCFNSKYKNLARWDCERCSDYRFITKLLKNKKDFKRKFVNKILTGVQHTDKMGLLGQKEKIKEENVIDISSLTNMIGNINAYKELFPCANKQIVNIKQPIAPKARINTNNVLKKLDINKTKLGLCMCVHNRYKLTKLCLQYLNSLSFEKIIICYSDDNAYNNLSEFHNNEKNFFIKSDNYPVSLKWNNCIKASKQFKLDGIMLLGDDDIIDEKYVNYCKLYLENKYDYITNLKWYYLIIEDKIIAKSRYINRTNYDGLGSGRVISKRILEIYNYNIYNFNLNKSLDSNSFDVFKKSIQKIHYSDEYFVYCLSFSNDKSGITINGSTISFLKHIYRNSETIITCDRIYEILTSRQLDINEEIPIDIIYTNLDNNSQGTYKYLTCYQYLSLYKNLLSLNHNKKSNDSFSNNITFLNKIYNHDNSYYNKLDKDICKHVDCYNKNAFRVNSSSLNMNYDVLKNTKYIFFINYLIKNNSNNSNITIKFNNSCSYSVVSNQYNCDKLLLFNSKENKKINFELYRNSSELIIKNILLFNVDEYELKLSNNIMFRNGKLPLITEIDSTNHNIKKKYNMIFCIPIHYRFDILNIVISNIMKSSLSVGIILVYSNDKNYDYCEKVKQKYEDIFPIWCHNIVSCKFNISIKYLQCLDYECAMILGSDDIVTPKYIMESYNHVINNDTDIYGTTSFNIIHNSSIYKFKYINNNKDFPIGCGRVLSKKFLQECDYNIFDLITTQLDTLLVLLIKDIDTNKGKYKFNLVESGDIYTFKRGNDMMNPINKIFANSKKADCNYSVYKLPATDINFLL